ncbi:Pantothenate synthetase [Smittium culicis]|uniref:Pantoate--beta-alanine ligase n=1 Tax=Smittium culicis TaxID=133412 RepID=A0A1R1WXI4_9FUNG|nr:Pantothenate synthetase [Smittium culicis]
MRAYRLEQIRAGLVVGFVPTMGALHSGHIKLVKEAAKSSSVVIVSIFVNPTQFAPNEDFDQYPRTLENDLLALEKLDGISTVVFAPTVREMYPSLENLRDILTKGTFVSVDGLSEQLEGSIRKTFFRGVATVVTKLLVLVRPDFTVFGQKDIQQCIVVRRLAMDLLLEPGTIRVSETERDPIDGLALSSRNVYLTPEQRKHAPAVYRGLKRAKELFTNDKVVDSKKLIDCVLMETEKEGNEHFKFDYIKISSSADLSDVQNVGPEGAIMSCAWKMGTTRLIDNVLLGFSI